MLIYGLQNKEAEAKEELKRRAKQLEHQRREQQRIQRAQPSYPSGGGGGGGSGYASNSYSSMAGGYTATPTIDRDYSTPRTASPAFSAAPTKAPAFKGTGMKLGAKKGTARGRDELIEAMGGEADEPRYVEPEREPEVQAVQADEHVLPQVEKERWVAEETCGDCLLIFCFSFLVLSSSTPRFARLDSLQHPHHHPRTPFRLPPARRRPSLV